MWAWGVAEAVEPPWTECREEVAVLTDAGVLGEASVDLPFGSTAPDLAGDVNGARLVVDRAGSWVLDGSPVDALPPLERVVVFADRELPAPEVVELEEALRSSGAAAWLARRATGSRRDDVDAADLARERAALAECRPGRRALAATTCEELWERWARVERAWACGSDLHRPPPRTRLAEPDGTPIALEPWRLDPADPVYWRADQTLAELRSDEGWVVIGQRPPGSYRASTGYSRHALAAWVPFQPGTCRVRVFAEPDGHASRVDVLACRPGQEEGVRQAVLAADWYTGAGSERDTRVVFEQWVHVRGDPTVVDPSRTTAGETLGRGRLAALR